MHSSQISQIFRHFFLYAIFPNVQIGIDFHEKSTYSYFFWSNRNHYVIVVTLSPSNLDALQIQGRTETPQKDQFINDEAVMSVFKEFESAIMYNTCLRKLEHR